MDAGGWEEKGRTREPGGGGGKGSAVKAARFGDVRECKRFTSGTPQADGAEARARCPRTSHSVPAARLRHAVVTERSVLRYLRVRNIEHCKYALFMCPVPRISGISSVCRVTFPRSLGGVVRNPNLQWSARLVLEPPRGYLGPSSRPHRLAQEPEVTEKLQCV